MEGCVVVLGAFDLEVVEAVLVEEMVCVVVDTVDLVVVELIIGVVVSGSVVVIEVVGNEHLWYTVCIEINI